MNSLSPHLGAPRMVTQDSSCADVCFDWSCHHRPGVVLLSLPLLCPSQAYAPVFSWCHLLRLLKRHVRPVLSMSQSLPIDNALSVKSGGSLTIWGHLLRLLKSHVRPVLSMSKSLPIDNALSVTSGGSLTIPSAG